MSFRKKLLSCIALTPLISLVIFLSILVSRYVSDQMAYLQELQLEILEARSSRLSSLFLSSSDRLPQVPLSPGDLKGEQGNVCHPSVELSWINIGKSYRYIYCASQSATKKVVLLPEEELESLLSASDFIKLFVVSRGGYVVGAEQPQFLSQKLDQLLEGIQVANWIGVGGASFEAKNKKEGSMMVNSFVSIEGTHLFLLAMTPKNIAVESASPFLLKGLFAIFLLTIGAIFLGFFLSHSLTRKITKLNEALQVVGKGEFDSKLDVQGNDEIDKLYQGFNKMLDEILGLLHNREEKVEIETRLNTASEVQKSFLPEARISRPGLEIRSVLTQAEDIGGDWWSFFEKEDFYYVMVADVTGHGLKSALITSAAKATLSHIENDFEVNTIMEAFNRSVYDVAQGALQMTAILVRFDKSLTSLSYCNASHEPPIYFLGEDESQVEMLLEVCGPRLGENRSYKYRKHEKEFSGDFKMLLYSDGLVDLRSPKGKTLGDSKLIRLMKKAIFSGNVDQNFQFLNTKVDDFRSGEPLDDDLTYVYVEGLRPKDRSV